MTDVGTCANGQSTPTNLACPPFVQWCEDQGIENLNDLTGRDIHQYKVWRRTDGDLSKATLKTQIDTVRVFMKWLVSIEGCDPDLPAKVKSPSLSSEENSRSVELHAKEAETVLSYLRKYEYGSLRHVTLTLLWHTMMRREQHGPLMSKITLPVSSTSMSFTGV